MAADGLVTEGATECAKHAPVMEQSIAVLPI